MRLVSAILIIFLTHSTQVIAQEECKTIIDNDERLACYDIAVGAIETETKQPLKKGNWILKTDVSPLTDDKNVFLSLTSENVIPSRFGGSGKGRMWVRCMENTTSIFVNFNEAFMSDHAGGGRVEYRLDKSPLSRAVFRESNDNKGLGLWSGNEAIPLIKRMLGHEKMVIRATPFSESSITLTFDISGFENAVSELRETCNW